MKNKENLRQMGGRWTCISVVLFHSTQISHTHSYTDGSSSHVLCQLLIRGNLGSSIFLKDTLTCSRGWRHGFEPATFRLLDQSPYPLSCTRPSVKRVKSYTVSKLQPSKGLPSHSFMFLLLCTGSTC